MEFFLEMLLTAVVAVLFSFLVAKLVSATMVGDSGGGVHDQAEKTEIGVGDGFGLKVDAPVIETERRLRVVVDELEEAAKGEDFVVTSDESLIVVSPENVIAEEMIVRGEDEQSDSAEEKVSEDRKECIVRTADEASVSPENVIAEEIMIRGQEEEGSGEVVVAESEECIVEESNTVEESEPKMELDTEDEVENEEKGELIIEEDDDWEGIERSELEKAFATASNILEESMKAEEISDEAKMELYGLHKIATEGSCQETQPMAIMVSARAKWKAWQKLGNMSQEEAMEQYLALVSKEIPGLLNTVGKMPETETSVVLPPNSGSSEDSTKLDITGLHPPKMFQGKDESSV